MSLYNILFGVNNLAPLLLATLKLSPGDIPRFRDCYLDGNEIAIHTRTGGGNRDYYGEPNEDNTEGPWNSELTEHNEYLRDEDDSFDCTYATFYFKFPAEYAADLTALAAKNETHTPSEKWQALFKTLEIKV